MNNKSKGKIGNQQSAVQLDLTCLNNFVASHNQLLDSTVNQIEKVIAEMVTFSNDDNENKNEAKEKEEKGENSQDAKQEQKPTKLKIVKKGKLTDAVRPILSELQAQIRAVRETFMAEIAVECVKVGSERKGPVLLTPPAKLNLNSAHLRRNRPRVCWPTEEDKEEVEKMMQSLTQSDTQKLVEKQQVTEKTEDQVSTQELVIEGFAQACTAIPYDQLEAFLDDIIANMFLKEISGEALALAKGVEQQTEAKSIPPEQICPVTENNIEAVRGLLLDRASDAFRDSIKDIDDKELTERLKEISVKMAKAKEMILEVRKLKDLELENLMLKMAEQVHISHQKAKKKDNN